jgi:A/G-specific adenine glycosylase
LVIQLAFKASKYINLNFKLAPYFYIITIYMPLEIELLKWYNFNKRNLPWRKNNDPYRVWVSEIILQQTRITQGKKYFNDFIDKFPTIYDLANSDEDTVLKSWQGLGYYNRAINLHKTSKFIVNDLGGKFPTTYDQLIKLKGIGDYTASAISSICFDRYNPVVDGNVLRFISRIYGITTPIDSTQGKKIIKEFANKLIQKTKTPGDFNQALMEFGALSCTPFPDCQLCIFNSKCLAFKKNKVDLIPVKTQKKKIRNRYFNYLVFKDNDGKTFINQRKEKDIWYKLYQFPLIEKDVLVDDISLSSDFSEYLTKNKLKISNTKHKIIRHKHVLSHQHLFIAFYLINLNTVINDGYDISNLNDFTFPVPISNFINKYLI